MLTGKLKKSILRQTEFSSFFNKKYLLLLLSIILVVLLVIGLKISFAVENEVTSIDIDSNTLNYGTDNGSWRVTAKASFSALQKGKASVTFKVKSKAVPKNNIVDLVLLVDDSIIDTYLQDNISTMNINYEDADRFAVIKFNSVGKLVSDFNNSPNFDNSNYGSLDGSSGLSYYVALSMLNEFLERRTFDAEHELDVLLITDGNPARDIGLEVDLYSKIREAFPELKNFYAIQYNEKGEINDTLKQISDVQFLAKDISSFISIINDSDIFHSTRYDVFDLNTSINTDFFTITNIKQTYPYGQVKQIADSAINWKFDKNDLNMQLFSGNYATLKVELELKDEYKGVSGLYQILKNTSIDYKINDVLETVTSTDSPIISNYYSVIYNANAPSGCIVTNVPSVTNSFVGDTVVLSEKIPVCNGYKFKGWKANVAVHSNSFIMPSKNVTLIATWSKISLNKSMNGTVLELPELYDMIADNSLGVDTNVVFSQVPTISDSGIYTRNGTENDQYPVHYYRGVIKNNNVLFAGFCWKMVRTTSTGGVKLIYNGIPVESYNYGPIAQDKYINISDNENSPYTYDEATDRWNSPQISGGGGSSSNAGAGTMSFSVAEAGKYAVSYSITSFASAEILVYKDGTLMGKDSALQGTSNGVISLENLSSTNVIMVKLYTGQGGSLNFSVDKVGENIVKSCNNTGVDSQLSSTSQFNTNYDSPADVGYMYGTEYMYNSYWTTIDVNILNGDYMSSGSNYYYGNSITYTNGTYTLTNASQKTWSDSYSSLVGYYTCKSAYATCSTVYYIVGSTSSYQYTLSLSDGTLDPSTQTITLGKEIADNGDGTYSLVEPITIRKEDWYTTYGTYKGYYLCRDLASTTCENKNLITSTNNYQLSYDRTFDYIYGNDVSWDGSKYTLIDTFTSTNFWSTDRISIAKKYHYTCLNTTGECDKAYYIHYFGNDTKIYYLTLSSGKDIETAKDEMFASDNNSTIKQTIDNWYTTNLLLYTKKIEDTIWCNDRTLYSGSLVGKDTTGGTEYSYFDSYNRVINSYNPSVTCPNEPRDGFTVLIASGGNGTLTYPVGLLTADEVMLAGGRSSISNKIYYLYTGQAYFIMSPGVFDRDIAHNFIVSYEGKLYYYPVYLSYGIRPAVSLKKGIKYTDGDGTVYNPFVVR